VRFVNIEVMKIKINFISRYGFALILETVHRPRGFSGKRKVGTARRPDNQVRF